MMQEMPIIPYGHQSIDQADIDAVVEVLCSDWLTTGPTVEAFEEKIMAFVGAAYGVAVSSGTAALHAAMHAVGVGPDDEVIVSPMTFVATVNAIFYVGATPVFADVCAASLLISPEAVEQKITPRTKAIIAVDYAGQPCDYAALRELADKYNLILVADACHSLGASYQGEMCGSLADLSVFSFHPVKPITTAEGGMIVTDRADLAEKMRIFRNHGITTDHRQRAANGAWFYEMTELGFNYRLSDLQCALGVSQLKQLPIWIKRRQQIAGHYDRLFADFPDIRPLSVGESISHGFHLYVVRVAQRDVVFQELRSRGINCNVHYIPVHLHPYYQAALADPSESFPVAEKAYAEILTLPIYPRMSDEQVTSIAGELMDVMLQMSTAGKHD